MSNLVESRKSRIANNGNWNLKKSIVAVIFLVAGLWLFELGRGALRHSESVRKMPEYEMMKADYKSGPDRGFLDRWTYRD